MPSATADGITMINFGMGSPNAATMMDLLSAIMPKAVLFLGKCGGLKRKNQLGDLVLPIAAIRGEGTSNDYLPPEVPALPAFALQRAVSTMIRDLGHDYWTGTVYTTNRRVWEHDDASRNTCARCAAWPSTWKPRRSSPPVSPTAFRAARCCWCRDQPMMPEGVKTEASDARVSARLRRAPHPDRHRGVAADPPARQVGAAPALRRVTNRRIDNHKGRKPIWTIVLSRRRSGAVSVACFHGMAQGQGTPGRCPADRLDQKLSPPKGLAFKYPGNWSEISHEEVEGSSCYNVYLEADKDRIRSAQPGCATSSPAKTRMRRTRRNMSTTSPPPRRRNDGGEYGRTEIVSREYGKHELLAAHYQDKVELAEPLQASIW